MRRLILAGLIAAAAAAAPPARIVSTAPSLTETLFALGLGPRVVGVTEFCRYPPEAAAKPKIGTFTEPNFERILAQKPDLVLVVRNPVQLAEKLGRPRCQGARCCSWWAAPRERCKAWWARAAARSSTS